MQYIYKYVYIYIVSKPTTDWCTIIFFSLPLLLLSILSTVYINCIFFPTNNRSYTSDFFLFSLLGALWWIGITFYYLYSSNTASSFNKQNTAWRRKLTVLIVGDVGIILYVCVIFLLVDIPGTYTVIIVREKYNNNKNYYT